MSKISYYFLLPILYLIALLPFRMLYLLSDLLFVLLYYVIRYRRDLVQLQLADSFPEKDQAEIQRLARKFYRYLTDLGLETLKTLTISPAAIKDRVAFDTAGVFRKYYKEDKSIIVAMGHFGNWEWAGARFAVDPIHPLSIIYRPLKSKQYDGLVHHMRSRLGNGLYPMKTAMRSILANRKKVDATAFIADQSPVPEHAHWVSFLHRETAFFAGMSKISKHLGYPIVYVGTVRKGRGHYEVIAETLVEDPTTISEHEITRLFAQRLESDIKSQPDIWLWSHRRWKHKRNKEHLS